MLKKASLKGFTFLSLLVLLISLLNPLFILKVGHRGKLFQGLYEHTGDAYDVVLLGSSHMNSSINPNILWSEYGITSYNYGTGGQPLDVTYYLLKEVLKNHNNPIVVIDLYYLGLTKEFGEEQYIRYVLDNIKLSQNKVEAVLHCTPREQWLDYLFPMSKYHTRWKELTKEDFDFDSSVAYYAKGFGAGRNIYGKDNFSVRTKETADLPSKTGEYLYKIIDLSKKEGFKLIFTNAPHDYTSTADMTGWHEEPAKMFNEVAQICREEGIPFINYCDRFSELGFDFKRDMYNAGHMNIWGSNKVSEHFAKFVNENYQLVDHRKEKEYAQWESDYKQFLRAEAQVANNKPNN